MKESKASGRNPEYKRKVIRLVEELRNSMEDEEEELEEEIGPNQELQDIMDNAVLHPILKVTTLGSIAEKAANYVDTLLPNQPAKPAKGKPGQKMPTGRKKQRRILYASAQDLYRKDKGKLLELIEEDNLQRDKDQGWKSPVLEGDNGDPSTECDPPNVDLPKSSTIERVISEADVRKHLESFDSRTAAGLDGVNVQSLKKIGTKETTLVLNGIIQGTIPEAWKCGRTSMIEKIVGAEDHGDFRPITVSSIWIRLLNRYSRKR